MAQLKVIVNKLNRRQAPVTDFKDKSFIKGTVAKGYLFVSESFVVNNLGKWYADRDGYYYWSGGLTVVSNQNPGVDNTANVIPVSGKAIIPSPKSTALELPVNRARCIATANWFDIHFKDQCAKVVDGTPFTAELLYAIACQETAIYFYDWTKDHTPGEVLARCVFDASGDVNGTRKAFPKNTAAFIERYGEAIADDLIKEANITRAWRGYSPKQWVYAGYGIFQYDLQHFPDDSDFFTQKLWYNMDDCLDRVMKELKTKWSAYPNDLHNTIRSYNGSGERAEAYANNVLQFLQWINNR